MISRFAQRLRVVVAMWIFVGFGGSLLMASFGIMAVTGTGVFHARSSFAVDAEFAPGEEVRTAAVRPGGFMVLAFPETTDPSTVACTKKSRVYSTGKQEIDDVVIEAPEGVAAVLKSTGSTPRRFVPVTVVDWMGTDFISCTGAGVESFALTSTRGINTDAFRYGAGAAFLLAAPLLVGLGLLALHLTRTWSRQASQAAYPQYPPTAYQAAYPRPADPQPPYPPLPPGHDPYATPPPR